MKHKQAINIGKDYGDKVLSVCNVSTIGDAYRPDSVEKFLKEVQATRPDILAERVIGNHPTAIHSNHVKDVEALTKLAQARGITVWYNWQKVKVQS